MGIVVFGCGQMAELYGKNDYVTISSADVTSEQEVLNELGKGYNVVINTAAKTDIDWCEQNKLEAFRVNVLGTQNVYMACCGLGIRMVQLSSGCIQESTDFGKYYTEDDPVSPACFYAWTKVWAENLLDKDKVLILRPRQLMSAGVSPRNTLMKFMSYSKFIDNQNSCTIAEDLVRVTFELIEKGMVGVYNVVNKGTISPYEVAKMLKRYIDPTMPIEKIEKSELNNMTVAKRVDALLSGEKLARIGIVLGEIHERVEMTCRALDKNLGADLKLAQIVLQEVRRQTEKKIGKEE